MWAKPWRIEAWQKTNNMQLIACYTRAVSDCMHGMNGSSLRWGRTVGRDDTSGGWQVTQSLRQMANQKKKKHTPKSVKSNPWSSSLWDCCETVNTVPHGKSVTPDLSNIADLISHKWTMLHCLLTKSSHSNYKLGQLKTVIPYLN